MPPKSVLIKIALFAGIGTGLVCLVDGLMWDFAPFNKYQGMFWLTFMPLILFFMKEKQDRKYLLNMWLSFMCGLVWGLVAIGAIAALSPAGPVILDIIIDFLICAAIVFVHKGLLDRTPLNAVACVFLGFAETLGCLQTSFPIAGELLPPYELERNRHARHLHLGHSGHVRAFLGMRRTHRKIRHGQAPLPRGRKRAIFLN
ncbi:MAG: DUF1097 family protein [Coriobacteriia bacterium]|nr:DUF1097 family protein [Coriobacteriia bacterium]